MAYFFIQKLRPKNSETMAHFFTQKLGPKNDPLFDIRNVKKLKNYKKLGRETSDIFNVFFAVFSTHLILQKI